MHAEGNSNNIDMKNRKRNRMKGFDYSSNNIYFVTICVQDRICCFGSVASAGTGRNLSVHNPISSKFDSSNSDRTCRDLSVQNNKVMQLNEFGKIVYERINWLSEQYKYVAIHNFVVMPNHVHIMLEIDSVCMSGLDPSVQLRDEEIKIKSLSSLIGAYKTTSSKIIHECGFLNFAWQRSFHDHIIRDEKSYLNISNYIDSNPEKWVLDTFFEKS
jgi:REP element-mobilizing transposase RayT